jgi:hypothetical protein
MFFLFVKDIVLDEGDSAMILVLAGRQQPGRTRRSR